MDLVDEDDGAASRAPPALLRRSHDFFDLFDTRQHRAERDEVRLRHLRDDPRERRLAGARRSPEDDRLQQVALDGLAQRFARTQDLVLADDLVKRPRPYPFREGSAGRRSSRSAQLLCGSLVVFVRK
jgi:hypothetical protein